MRRVLLVLVVVGCHPGGDDYPVAPGAAGVGGGLPTFADAGFDGSGANGGPQLIGQVCLITDPRDQTSCASTGAGGLTVTLGTSVATTADNGTFTIARPSGSNITWDVSEPALNSIIESITPFTAQAVIPAMPTVVYGQLEGDNGVVPQAGQGAVMLRVTQFGVPVAGATATAVPGGVYGTFYDGPTPSAWTANGTGSFGTAWIPALLAGSVDVTVMPQGGTPVVLSLVPIKEAAITFLTEELP